MCALGFMPLLLVVNKLNHIVLGINFDINVIVWVNNRTWCGGQHQYCSEICFGVDYNTINGLTFLMFPCRGQNAKFQINIKLCYKYIHNNIFVLRYRWILLIKYNKFITLPTAADTLIKLNTRGIQKIFFSYFYYFWIFLNLLVSLNWTNDEFYYQLKWKCRVIF